MVLRPLPKKDPRPKALTVRVSTKTYEQLLQLAEANNLSQADVIEQLLEEEYRRLKKPRSRNSRSSDHGA